MNLPTLKPIHKVVVSFVVSVLLPAVILGLQFIVDGGTIDQDAVYNALKVGFGGFVAAAAAWLAKFTPADKEAVNLAE